MRVQVATKPGSMDKPSEDRAVAAPNLVAVLDGATARTDTGCIHGVAWYTDQLGHGIVDNAVLGPTGALVAAIEQTADLHRNTCDLRHVATPSAAVAIVEATRDYVRYLVLGDVTVVIDCDGERLVVVDDRVSKTAVVERLAADALLDGSPEKTAALVRMKHAELAARNTAGGFWISASDPSAVEHALVGEVPLTEVSRVAVLTDGATRAVDTFDLDDWSGLMDRLTERGPADLIQRVREIEAADPQGVRWPRNKLSDDATVVYCDRFKAA